MDTRILWRVTTVPIRCHYLNSSKLKDKHVKYGLTGILAVFNVSIIKQNLLFHITNCYPLKIAERKCNKENVSVWLTIINENNVIEMYFMQFDLDVLIQ